MQEAIKGKHSLVHAPLTGDIMEPAASAALTARVRAALSGVDAEAIDAAGQAERSSAPAAAAAAAAGPSPAGAPTGATYACRPGDCGDFFRRLASYKASTWFGKPAAAGAEPAARRGWRNVGRDLLGCETCGARLSFALPAGWGRELAEAAAEKFKPKLQAR